MIVSWNWLKEYVPLDMDVDQLEQRLAMAGLNHESTERIGDDFAVDLEVTSNRPDCLGHVGVAREISVLWDAPLHIPAAQPEHGSTPVADFTKVTLDCPDLCYRYTARVIRGAQVGPSPAWLANRLRTIGVAVINNIVDISNYVLMECGQPLHVFDLTQLGGREIVVRQAQPGEEFEAIDHKTYPLESGMCVIADCQVPVAIGGVMGGAETEVSASTTEFLIEAAEFAPLSIRNTARKLNLHSPSSYRFERGVDPDGVDWASRRCCELILDLAGGELADGAIDVGHDRPPRQPIVLRLSQLERILGITIDGDEVRRILTALGCCERRFDASRVETLPPSWRSDLTREIDLVEEIARIHGYDRIPEDVGVPMAASHRSDDDRVLARIRRVITAAGFDEAMTASVVPAAWCDAFSPWTDAEPLVANTPLLRGADRLRRSLIPSLLDALRLNESLGNADVELFETARAYLPTHDGLPREPRLLGLVSGRDFFRAKGVVESIVRGLNPAASIVAVETQQPLLDPRRSAKLLLADKLLGFLGEVSADGLKQCGLRAPASIAEIDVAALAAAAKLVPQYAEQSPFPSISRDMNFVVDQSIRWSDLAATVRASAGEILEQLDYRETFRDAEKDGPGKKRLLLSVTLRRPDRTLTNEEADQTRDQIVTACHQAHQATLLA